MKKVDVWFCKQLLPRMAEHHFPRAIDLFQITVKAGDAKDASLKAPNGTEGVVIDKKLFQRAKKDKNPLKLTQTITIRQ